MPRNIRVLHIISQFAAGGIEKWLMDLHQLNNFNRATIKHQFLCISGKTGVWDKNIFSSIDYYPNIKKGKILFLLSIFKYSSHIKENFDIVHIHLYRFSAFIAFVFWACGYRNIVVHAHNDKRNAENRLPFIRRAASKLYGLTAKLLFKISSKICVAASKDAADDLFGLISNNKTRVIFCGIKQENKQSREVKEKILKELNLHEDDLIFTNIGSLTEQKNHIFLIDVFEKIIPQRKGIKLLIIGDGKLYNEISKIIAAKGLSENILMLGNKDDVLSILQNISSAFLFPSLFEGLGLALIEAQFSGNHCFISNAIPSEATVEPDLITRLELDISTWEQGILSFLETNPYPIIRVREKNHFSIESSAEKFSHLYELMCEKQDVTK